MGADVCGVKKFDLKETDGAKQGGKERAREQFWPEKGCESVPPQSLIPLLGASIPDIECDMGYTHQGIENTTGEGKIRDVRNLEWRKLVRSTVPKYNCKFGTNSQIVAHQQA